MVEAVFIQARDAEARAEDYLVDVGWESLESRADNGPGQRQQPSITTTDCRIRWLTVLVQLRISGCGKIATALCQVQFTHKNHLAS